MIRNSNLLTAFPINWAALPRFQVNWSTAGPDLIRTIQFQATVDGLAPGAIEGTIKLLGANAFLAGPIGVEPLTFFVLLRLPCTGA